MSLTGEHREKAKGRQVYDEKEAVLKERLQSPSTESPSVLLFL